MFEYICVTLVILIQCFLALSMNIFRALIMNVLLLMLVLWTHVNNYLNSRETHSDHSQGTYCDFLSRSTWTLDEHIEITCKGTLYLCVICEFLPMISLTVDKPIQSSYKEHFLACKDCDLFKDYFKPQFTYLEISWWTFY